MSKLIERFSRATKTPNRGLAVVLSPSSLVLRIDIALPTKKTSCSWVVLPLPFRNEVLKLKDNVQLKSYELWLIN